jgi:hypothetical protein
LVEVTHIGQRLAAEGFLYRRIGVDPCLYFAGSLAGTHHGVERSVAHAEAEPFQLSFQFGLCRLDLFPCLRRLAHVSSTERSTERTTQQTAEGRAGGCAFFDRSLTRYVANSLLAGLLDSLLCAFPQRAQSYLSRYTAGLARTTCAYEPLRYTGFKPCGAC